MNGNDGIETKKSILMHIKEGPFLDSGVMFFNAARKSPTSNVIIKNQALGERTV